MRKHDRRKSPRSTTFEKLEDRRMMSASVQLVDGSLILQGTTHGHNHLTVSPDSNGKTLFARADGVKKHFSASEIKSIQIVGGDKPDTISIDAKVNKPAFIRAGGGADSVVGGAGSNTIFGGAGNDVITGRSGDDLLLGQGGSNKIDAGKGDNPNSIAPIHNAANSTAVTQFSLIDASTNKTIATLTDGATINLAKLPKRLNVQAVVTKGGERGSVLFSYDGSTAKVENQSPFALAADNNKGDFYGWVPRTGTHTLSATPYANKNASGPVGTTLSISFTVVKDHSSAEIHTAAVTTTTSSNTTNSVATTSSNTQDSGATPLSNTQSTVDDTNTTTADNTDTSTDRTNAPVAAIDLADANIPAGTSVFANALKSTLTKGNALTTKYEWNFGDTGSKYNTLTGFNVAHQYTTPGTYTLSLKITNSAGKVDTVTKTITVNAVNRTMVYVSPTGNDSNNGSSQSSAVKSFARASELVGNNTEILFQRGGTYTTSESMNLGHTNVMVTSYGTGAEPILKYTGGLNYGAILVTLGGKNVTIQDVAFDSSSTTMKDTGFNDAVRVGGEGITVRDCTFINAGYAINTNGLPDGVLVQDNMAPNQTSLRAYFAWVQGSDQVYLGNTAKDVMNGHDLRVGGADRVNIQSNNFTNLSSTGGLRGTLTIHKGSYMYIANNTLNDGTLGLGPLDRGEAGMKNKDGRLEWTVIENNNINAILKIGSGTDHVSVRNNVIKDDDNIAIDMPGYSSTYGRGTSDVSIDHNTIINEGKNGKFLKVGGAIDNVSVTHNLYVAPNLITGSYNSAPMDILNKDLTGFTSISDNVWPSPTILANAQGGINYIGNGTDSSGYKTPAEWSAYKVVQHDQYMDVTLSSAHDVNINGISAGAAA